MNLTDLYVKWIDYIHACILSVGEYARNKIIIRHQSVSPPQKPFIDLHITDIRREGTAISQTYDSVSSEMTYTYAMTASMEIRSFADSLLKSEGLLYAIIDTFDMQYQQNIWGGVIGYRGIIKEVMSVPMSINNQQESQSIVIVKFGYNHTRNEYLSWIETVDLSFNN